MCGIGFQASSLDPCLYIKIVEGQCVLLLVHVDDVLITGSSCELIARTETNMKTRFEMTDSGKCAFVPGIELLDGADGSVTLYQHRYIDDILKRFGMNDCKAVASPVDMSSRLVSSNAATKVDVPFREAVGALMHLTTAARPDIAFAVGCVSRLMENPKKSTGLRSRVSYDAYKARKRMGFATSQTARSTSVDIRMRTGLVILPTASQLRGTRSCYLVRQ